MEACHITSHTQVTRLLEPGPVVFCCFFSSIPVLLHHPRCLTTLAALSARPPVNMQWRDREEGQGHGDEKGGGGGGGGKERRRRGWIKVRE